MSGKTFPVDTEPKYLWLGITTKEEKRGSIDAHSVKENIGYGLTIRSGQNENSKRR